MEILKSTKLGKVLWKAQIPRWIVFLLDQSVVLFSYFILIILYGVILNRSIEQGVAMRIMNALFVFSLVDLTMGVYKGAIRYSEIREMVRIFFYVLSSCLILFFLSRFLDRSIQLNPLTLSWTCVFGLITFTLLSLKRIAIKYTYYYLGTMKKVKRRVIVFGTDSRTAMLVNMMKTDVKSDYKPVAFIDTNSLHTGKNLMGIKVLDLTKIKSISTFISDNGAEALMITDNNKSKLSRELLDSILEKGIKVLLIAHPHDMNESNLQKNISVHDIQIEDLLNRDIIVTNNCEVKQLLRKKTVLVTGAAGSIGSEIVMQIAAAGPSRLLLLDQAESPLHEIQLKLESSFPELNLEVYICDIRNLKRMEELFRTFRPELVYHAAAYKHVPMMENHPCESVMVNIVGTRQVVDLSVKYGAERFVMVSTDKAVNPTNVMGCSKRIAEIYVQSLYLELAKKSTGKTKIITTRFGNVLGSNGSVVPLFKNQIAKGGPVTVTHKDIIRYFMTIPEACRLVLEAGCMGKGGEIFVFDMGAPVKIYDMAKRMIRLAGLTPGKDIEIVETGLRPGEKLYEELLNDEELTLPTHHKKIMIAKVREYTYDAVRDSIDELRVLATSGDKMATVGAMKSLVPEFKSKNSKYELLDVTAESKFA